MTVVRLTLSALWLSLVIAILAVVGLSRIAPALGYPLIVIAGPSMTPTIPLGAVVIERTVPVDAIAIGDVVTVQMPNGIAITHRVVRLGAIAGATYLETRGDANDGPDPVVVPAGSVSGVVTLALPMVGFLLAYLAVPSGMASIVLMLGALMLAIWSLEEGDGEPAGEAPAPAGPDVVDGFPA